jgi:CBS-domain-containing membrane protein
MAAMKAMQGYIDITPADFREVYRVAYVLAQERMMTALKAAEIMTAPPITAAADLSISAIPALLMEKNINRLPIVGADGKPVGIVTRSDLVNNIAPARRYPEFWL